METKICKKCGIDKPLDQFWRSRAKYRRTVCAECMAKTACACGRKSSGQEKCRSCRIGRDWKNRIHSLSAWLNQCLRSTKYASPSRKARHYRVKENDLDTEYLLDLWEKQSGKCAVTGMEMATQSGNIRSASIDRIDPTLGYLRSNVMLTCQWANLGRGRATIEEFREILACCNSFFG